MEDSEGGICHLQRAQSQAQPLCELCQCLGITLQTLNNAHSLRLCVQHFYFRNLSYFSPKKQVGWQLRHWRAIPLVVRTDAGLLSVMLVRDGQLLAAFGATAGQHAATVLRGHALAETMLVHTAAVVGLKCSFHVRILFVSCCLLCQNEPKPTFRAAKLHNSF